MTTSGWILMGVTWAAILLTTAFTCWRAIRKKSMGMK